MGKVNNILIVCGVELDTPYGHILVYMDEPDEKILQINNLNELLDYSKEHEYLTSIAHPYGNFLVLPFPILKKKELIDKIDAIEIINGRVSNRGNTLAYELAVTLSKYFTGGSDAHLLSEVGNVGLMCYENIDSFDDLINLIKHGKVKPYGRVRTYKVIAGILKTSLLKPSRLLHRWLKY